MSTTKPPTKRISILGTPLTVQTLDGAIRTLLAAAEGARMYRVHFCTVHTVVQARSNRALREAFAGADALNMDGVPLTWIARLRGAAPVERVCGPDVMPLLMDRGRDLGLRHYLFGGAPGVADALAKSMAKRFPGLQVVGMKSPPFRPATPEEDAAHVNAINGSGADVLWIGLGSPKQEIWAADHASLLTARLILPVGAAFDFHAGRVRRAPTWMQRSGLEWLFRALVDRRLIRRYVSTNLRFLWLVVREELARRQR